LINRIDKSERYKKWSSLTKSAGDLNKKNIIVRELPGFAEIENDFVLAVNVDRHDWSVQQKAELLSKKTFGITQSETKYCYPKRYQDLSEDSWEREKFETEFDRVEKKYEVLDDSDESVVELLLQHNLDFRDSAGRPMRCINLFKRQAFAAASGIKGNLPNIREIKNENWGNNLAAEARSFQMKRKK
jgi:hypothetical protein